MKLLRDKIREILLKEAYAGEYTKSEYTPIVEPIPYHKRNINGRAMERFIHLIKEKIGLNVIKYLGKGNFGYAFMAEGNKTVKITRDKSEAVEANKCLGKNLKHMPNVYGIYKLKVTHPSNSVDYTDQFIIVKEYTHQNPRFIKMMKNMINSLSVDLYEFTDDPEYRRLGARWFTSLMAAMNDNEISDEKIFQFIEFLKSKNYNRSLWLMTQLNEIFKEMRSLGIKTGRDIKDDNLGLRNGQLILLDVGFGDFDGQGFIEKQPYFDTVEERNQAGS